MPTPNMRTLQLLGSLVALNLGLFVFNNLPLIQVPQEGFERKLSAAREASREIRQKAWNARRQAIAARQQARVVIRRANAEIGKQQGRQKLDHLTCLHQLENLDHLKLSVDVPPPLPAIVLPPELRDMPSGAASHTSSKWITLHEYFRDRVL